MLKIILLLTPIYVTLFWMFVLNFNNVRRAVPQVFLGKFMLIASIVYLSHFLYYYGKTNAYLYIDAIYQLATLLVYPLFYIYVRLLTIDPQFSITHHLKYIITPILLSSFYIIAIATLPTGKYEEFVYTDGNLFHQDYIFVSIIYCLMRILALLQVILVVWHSQRLIVRYKDKAIQYYSDDPNSAVEMLKMQNLTMVIMGITSIGLIALGRLFFSGQLEIVGIAVASVIFSSMLFLIGWLGSKQRVINPTFELDDELKNNPSDDSMTYSKDTMEHKLNVAMIQQKMYLNSKLTIYGLAQQIGTCRTSLSTYINKECGKNYCAYVNDFRIDAMKELIHKNSKLSHAELAESCGFGSTDSMKRAISLKYNMRFSEWKASILES